jgi:glycosyltransferase involved in cell wall biosynthesis
MNQPLVSVIVPVFNGERFLGQALESIMAQDYAPFEVIVVDDGSTDGSAAISRSYKDVRYICQENSGVAVAKNAGITAARGEFIAFLDHDDTWPPNKLRVQAGYLVDHPETGCVFSRHHIFLEPGTPRPPWLKPEFLENDQLGAFACTMVVRKAVFDAVGVFGPDFRVGEDTDWIARAKDAGVRMTILPDVLLYRRVHSSNISSIVDLHHATMARLVRASLERKRQQEAERQKEDRTA